jgi:manganese transport protein
MLTQEAVGFFISSDNIFAKVLIIVAGFLFVALLVSSFIYPLLGKTKKPVSIQMHPEIPGLQNIEIPTYKKIAVALDFSENDIRLLASAIGQARHDTSFVLIHIVESPTARLLGNETDDFETENDQQRLNTIVRQLKEKGYDSKGILGFQSRAKEIARIVKEENADMLIVGAHGHSGLKDFIYGETINAVRHELKIPVLIVHL